jgi:hypothetical protein
LRLGRYRLTAPLAVALSGRLTVGLGRHVARHPPRLAPLPLQPCPGGTAPDAS